MNKAVTFAKADGKRNYLCKSRYWIAFFKPNVKQIPLFGTRTSWDNSKVAIVFYWRFVKNPIRNFHFNLFHKFIGALSVQRKYIFFELK
jgi:hypothetical protein